MGEEAPPVQRLEEEARGGEPRAPARGGRPAHGRRDREARAPGRLRGTGARHGGRTDRSNQPVREAAREAATHVRHQNAEEEAGEDEARREGEEEEEEGAREEAREEV